MTLVGYSDSEGSEDEQPQRKQIAEEQPQGQNTGITQPGTTNFTVDRSRPRVIRVNLSDALKVESASNNHEDEPPAKRARTGGGSSSGFNAMLPAPKRENLPLTNGKAPTRKVFSLKTGAEPGFSRESDAELRQLFAENGESQDVVAGDVEHDESTTTSKVTIPDPPKQGNAMLFKPLSVARNTKKKKKPVAPTVIKLPEPPVVRSHPTPSSPPARQNSLAASGAFPRDRSESVKKMEAPRVSLFATHHLTNTPKGSPPLEEPYVDHQDDPSDIYGSVSTPPLSYPSPHVPPSIAAPSNDLHSIASDLNLSAAEKRQLLGRKGANATVANVVNFNTDEEYAANQAAIEAGEQVQHNPVRAIAPGKHNLKQLVSSAAGQKDALEESFARGRFNKKEAGSKYGW